MTRFIILFYGFRACVLQSGKKVEGGKDTGENASGILGSGEGGDLNRYTWNICYGNVSWNMVTVSVIGM